MNDYMELGQRAYESFCEAFGSLVGGRPWDVLSLHEKHAWSWVAKTSQDSVDPFEEIRRRIRRRTENFVAWTRSFQIAEDKLSECEMWLEKAEREVS